MPARASTSPPATRPSRATGTCSAQWRHPDQLDAIGGFAGLFRLPGRSERALVASTDGVGTKILIAAELERYDERRRATS